MAIFKTGNRESGNGEWERGLGTGNGNQWCITENYKQGGLKQGIRGCQTEKQPKYVFRQGSSKQIAATSSVRNVIQSLSSNPML